MILSGHIRLVFSWLDLSRNNDGVGNSAPEIQPQKIWVNNFVCMDLLKMKVWMEITYVEKCHSY
jgi:hypothetical protein